MNSTNKIIYIVIGLILFIAGTGLGYGIQKNKQLNEPQSSDNRSSEEKEAPENNDVKKTTTKSEIPKPSFIDKIIAEGMVDRIYKYSHKGISYYYMTGWEKVDGSPRVFTLNGEEVDCNFPSPMVVQTEENKRIVNPICEGYESGVQIYSRR